MTVSCDEFKAGLALWASGVTIVAARAGERVHGMTVSAFSSVSLDPPLVLVCVDRASITLGLIREGGCFAANVLARGQEALSDKFASKKDEHRRFDGLETLTGKTGAPLIPGALANVDCRLVSEHDAGDHVIYIGRVEQIITREVEPLVFYRGAYRVLDRSAAGLDDKR